MSPDALAELSMTEAADAFARGDVTAASLLDATLHRLERHGGKVNAVVRLDRDEARVAAAAADQARKAGARPGKLAGVPMMHKDMYYRAGKVSTCGSRIRRDFVPAVTATVLQRLDAAGAIDCGTLNMAEFAQNPTGHNAHFGDAMNPWNAAHCTGGSSSGSGAIVGARIVTAALGSDTGGSIRLPAAMCGVTGLKPTQTRVPRTGVMPLSFSADNVGPLCRTARDAARFLDVTAGACPGDPTSSKEPVAASEAGLDGDIRGLRVAVCQSWFFDDIDASVLKGFEAAMAVLKGLGAAVEVVKPGSLFAVATYTGIVSRVEGATIHQQWMRERAGDYAAHLSARIYGGNAIPATAYLEALSRRGPLLRRFCDEALGRFDIVATPTLRDRVPTRAETDIDADPDNWDRFMDLSRNTRPFNYLGLPTVSIPAGFDDGGLPLGLQLAARPFAEARLLKVADAFQRETDWHRRTPF
ncbi:amidase [Roseococcus sp. SYP-B2431]|uniref:amidase n=1 Tax=Roseococcus sp. SYP-B2431 TaxID=2496640 RepID=UPI00103BDD15|nr:amidase [Roseococcus sp. SYP-B2431]TCH99985.1 amidase [Roseococcus sp. SYP-B2431]